MAHMRTVKEAHEKQRAIYMNMCMADFISPDYRFRSRQLNPRRSSDSPQRRRGKGKQAQMQSEARADESTLHVTPDDTPGASAAGTPTIATPEATPTRTPIRSPTGSRKESAEDGIQGLTESPPEDLQQDELDNVDRTDFVESEGPSTEQDDPDGDHPTDSGQPVAESTIRPDENRYPSDDFLQQTVDMSTSSNIVKQSPSTLSPDTINQLSPGPQRGRSPSRQSTKGSTTSSRSPPPRNITEADHQRAFDRATYLIRQSMSFSQFGGGGVVLLDTNANANSADPVLRRHEDDYEDLAEALNVERLDVAADHGISASHPGPGSRQGSAYSGAMKERVVLAAASVTDGRTPRNFGRADPSWRVTLAPPELQRMCKRHPRGKLYDLPDHIGTSLFDWEGRPVTGRLSSKLYELVLLRRQFPQAKQVIFVPMFHV